MISCTSSNNIADMMQVMPKRSRNSLQDATINELRNLKRRVEQEEMYKHNFLQNLQFMSPATHQQLRKIAPGWVHDALPAPGNTFQEYKDFKADTERTPMSELHVHGGYWGGYVSPSVQQELQTRVLSNRKRNISSWQAADIIDQIKVVRSKKNRPISNLSVPQLIKLLRQRIAADEKDARRMFSIVCMDRQQAFLTYVACSRHPVFLKYFLDFCGFYPRYWPDVARRAGMKLGAGRVGNREKRRLLRSSSVSEIVRHAMPWVQLDFREIAQECPLNVPEVRQTFAESLSDAYVLRDLT